MFAKLSGELIKPAMWNQHHLK